ncbi:MAG TPA: hypothetical protein VGJ84_07940 [Polyangiaceae bacterium]
MSKSPLVIAILMTSGVVACRGSKARPEPSSAQPSAHPNAVVSQKAAGQEPDDETDEEEEEEGPR